MLNLVEVGSKQPFALPAELAVQGQNGEFEPFPPVQNPPQYLIPAMGGKAVVRIAMCFRPDIHSRGVQLRQFLRQYQTTCRPGTEDGFPARKP